MWTADLRRAALAASWGDSYTHWKGVEVLKHPNDLVSMQEIIWDTKPDVIIETGTWKGGSAMFYADLGVEVHSVDKAPASATPPYPGVHYYRGESTLPRNLYRITQAVQGKRVMVSLDSDHSKANVLAELDAYHRFVSIGCYLVVEDTALGTWLTGTVHDDGDGPAAALDEWLPAHPEFQPDAYRERFGPTMHPGGWLLRT